MEDFQLNARVLRWVEGLEFPAVVIGAVTAHTCDIQYQDDHAIEAAVPFDELRQVEGTPRRVLHCCFAHLAAHSTTLLTHVLTVHHPCQLHACRCAQAASSSGSRTGPDHTPRAALCVVPTTPAGPRSSPSLPSSSSA